MQTWPHRIIGRSLIAFALLVLAQSSRADGVPFVEALGLGESVEQLKAIRPDSRCTSYRYNSGADVSCSILQGGIFGIPTLLSEINFIGNRLTSATIVVLSPPEELSREMTKRLGAAGKEGVAHPLSWQRDGYTLRLQFSINCVKVPCEHGIFLEDDKNPEVVKMRREAIEAQRPDIGNLTPNGKQFEAGRNLLRFFRRALGMKSVSPGEIEAALGLKVLLIADEQNARYKGALNQAYSVTGSTPPGVASDLKYHLRWGYPDESNGGRFAFRIDDKIACITEQLLVDEFGTSGEQTYSTFRTFGPDRLAPKGIRPRVETKWYKTEDGVRLGFSYDFVCASGVSLFD